MSEDKPGFSDQRETKRRDDEDRRKEERINLEENGRQGERRENEERRSRPFGLIYNTPHTAATLEDWMEDNCEGDWDLGLEGIDTDRKLKRFKVMFENEEDKKAFVKYFSR